MIKEHYLNNDLIDAPLDFYDIDKSNIDDNLNYKETYIIHNGYATSSFNHNINDFVLILFHSGNLLNLNPYYVCFFCKYLRETYLFLSH